MPGNTFRSVTSSLSTPHTSSVPVVSILITLSYEAAIVHSYEEPKPLCSKVVRHAIVGRTPPGAPRLSLSGTGKSHIAPGSNSPDPPDPAMVKSTSLPGGPPTLTPTGRHSDKKTAREEASNNGISKALAHKSPTPTSKHTVLTGTVSTPTNESGPSKQVTT